MSPFGIFGDIMSMFDIPDFLDGLRAGAGQAQLTWTTEAQDDPKTGESKPGWSGQDVEDVLQHYGVKVYGRRLGGKTASVSVTAKQKVWAEYLLQRAGVPLSGNCRRDTHT